MKTPSASTVKDMTGVPMMMDGQNLPVFAKNDSTSAIIAKNKAPNINHEIYLQDDEKDMHRIMSKDEIKRRQDELVQEQGLDEMADFETDLA